MIELNDNTFPIYAAKHYENPHCVDIEEFEEDIKRFQYLRKLFSRYKTIKDLRERLILNHLIIIYNCFGINATDMLFMKLDEHHDCLKPFVEYLNYLPEKLYYNGIVINTSKITSDKLIKEKLGEI